MRCEQNKLKGFKIVDKKEPIANESLSKWYQRQGGKKRDDKSANKTPKKLSIVSTSLTNNEDALLPQNSNSCIATRCKWWSTCSRILKAIFWDDGKKLGLQIVKNKKNTQEQNNHNKNNNDIHQSLGWEDPNKVSINGTTHFKLQAILHPPKRDNGVE